MRIALLGAGRVGGALGRGWAAAGHEVIVGLREGRAALPDGLGVPGVRAASLEGAVGAAEAVLLATPWSAAEAVLRSVGDFGGRPLLDATNPLGPGMALTHGHGDSGGEQVQRWAPTARVVKVFNTTGAENMANPRFGDARALMLACGDDDAAVAVAVSLAVDLGFEALPFGPLRNARLLEPFGRTWIELALVRGAGSEGSPAPVGRGIAFGLLRRPA